MATIALSAAEDERAIGDEDLPAATPSPNPALMLADDHAKRHPKRVQLATVERARILLDGPELVREDPRPPFETETPFVVVDESGDWVRVVSEAYHMRILAWVHHNQLRSVVVQRERVLPASNAGAASDEGVVVYPGLAIEAKGREKGFVRASYDDDGLSFTGWVPSAAVAFVYKPNASLVEWTADCTIARGTIVVRSDGSTIASFKQDMDAQRVGAVTGGKQRIAYRKLVAARDPGARGAVEINGWVDARAVSSLAGSIGAIGGGGEGWGGSHTRRVPKGTRLYAAPNGQLVGVTIDEAIAHEGETKNGVTALEMNTIWGFTTFYAELADGAP